MNNNVSILTLLLSLLIFSGISYAKPSEVDIRLEGPRKFGYTLGDTIQLKAHINSPVFYHLDISFLPQPGPVNNWLVLNAIKLKEDSSDDYLLEFSYQLFKGVSKTTQLAIPPLPVRFNRGRSSIETEIPAWSFTYAPLLPANIADNQIDVQPLQTARYIGDSLYYQILAWLMAGITLLAIYIAWFYGKIPFLERYSGTFGKACKELHTITRQPFSEQLYRQALQSFHHALNELAGETVFYEQLPDFFKTFPAYELARPETEALFEISRQLFFSHSRVDPARLSIQQIAQLCQLYRKIERSLRWA